MVQASFLVLATLIVSALATPIGIIRDGQSVDRRGEAAAGPQLEARKLPVALAAKLVSKAKAKASAPKPKKMAPNPQSKNSQKKAVRKKAKVQAKMAAKAQAKKAPPPAKGIKSEHITAGLAVAGTLAPLAVGAMGGGGGAAAPAPVAARSFDQLNFESRSQRLEDLYERDLREFHALASRSLYLDRDLSNRELNELD